MSLGTPKSAPATREQLESHKRDARGLLEAIARAVQEGNAGDRCFESGSLSYTLRADTPADLQAGFLRMKFQMTCLGRQDASARSFQTALTTELTRWGIENLNPHPFDPLISPEMDRALDALYESFAATLGVPPVTASAPATVAELPVAAVTDPAAEVAAAVPSRDPWDAAPESRPLGCSLTIGPWAIVLSGLASLPICYGGPIYFRPPAEPGAEPAVLPIAPTPLQVLCEGGIPVTYKFKKEKGKTDVFKDGEEGVYQFALIDGGVVVAALAGSVPESCFDGKMPASFTDFRNVELVVTKAVRYVIPHDLSFDKDIARYAFEPAFQPRVETCPEKLPFPEWYTNGPYYQTILKPDGSFVLQTIDVALHKNLGWTATGNRLKTANTWLYVNEGTTQDHPSCGGYKHDVNALEGMNFINKLAHSNRSKFDLY